MCLGENSAHHAVHYLNAQLGSLWENSTECSNKAGKGLKPLERVRYDFALAEYHIGSKQRSKYTMKDDMMFSATFSKPRLEFVCNHEAVLYLKIKEVTSTGTSQRLTRLALFRTGISRNVQLHDMEVAFRMEFDINGFRGHTSHIGNGSHIIQLLVLDFNTAKLVSKVNVSGGRESLNFYLKKYLEYLRHAGHHVLFSLPDFDDDRMDVLIDYSLESHTIRNVETEIEEVFGVSVEEINRYLSSKWLKSIMDAAEGGDRKSTCLAEYRSTWTSVADHSNLQFHGDELLVYEGHNFNVAPKYSYHDWEIAVVVDLIKDVENTINLVKLDMSSIRFCNHLSVFSGFDLTLDFAATLKTTFVEFIDYYATALEQSEFHVIHSVDTARPETPVTEPSESENEPGTGDGFEVITGEGTISTGPKITSVKEVSTKSSTFGFDFVQAVSQQSIIEQFKSLWQLSRDATAEYMKVLGKWSFGDDFKASFGALKIRYLSNERAIVWIQVDEGALKTLNTKKSVDFADWSIAFEIKLTMSDQSAVETTSKSWFTRFKESFAWKQHGTSNDKTLKHLCLDFSTAEFVYELSKFEGLHLGTRTAVDSIKGAVYYLKDHYLSVLTSHGHHIMQSIPVWKQGTKPPSMALTGVNFQIYSKQIITRANCTRVSQALEATLVVLGMNNFKKFPAARLDYSTEWVMKGKKTTSHGTVCISRKVFLEERLLPLLAGVNATTTVVPVFPSSEDASRYVSLFTGHVGAEWGLALTTWASRFSAKQRKAFWELISGAKSTYKWDYTDKWSYEHEGAAGDKNNGIYLVSCQTKNNLHLPTTYGHGIMDIVLSGEIDIALGFKGETTRWNSKAVSKWSTTLSLISEAGGSGMTVEVKGDTKPKFETLRVHGDETLDKLIDLKTLHSIVRIDLDQLVSELKGTFGGVWEHCFPGMQAYSLCNPIFNEKGDILFELRPFVPRSQITPAVSKPRASARRAAPPVIVEAPTEPGRPPIKKSKSLLRRVGDGIQSAGLTVGGSVKDIFIKDEELEKSDTSKTTESKVSFSETASPVTPATDILAVKTPASEVPPPQVNIASGGASSMSRSYSSSSSIEITSSKILPQISKPIIPQAANGKANGTKGTADSTTNGNGTPAITQK
ncbi:hypothetical protein BDQ17DRAFT_1421498 [Cyathus striatus]|nr:hypothetical protein BDQ17DRAFT_1421498 [Cyathus striatus]